MDVFVYELGLFALSCAYVERCSPAECVLSAYFCGSFNSCVWVLVSGTYGVVFGLTTAKFGIRLQILNSEGSQAASQPASHFLFDMCYDITLFIRQLAGFL